MKRAAHIVVVGKENVGKTAVVVRYLTGRYLSEYAHAPEMTYERIVPVDGRQVPLKITDISGKSLETKASNKDFLSKVDGIVVVYAINDTPSYHVAEGVCNWVRRDRKSPVHTPILLLGNKADLSHCRCVPSPDTDETQWTNSSCLATEVSASTQPDHINYVFTSLINKILERREATLKPRKMSQNPLGSPKVIRATIKRRFSVFTRERTSTM
ncbi:ras-related and estrogen-regulated growth inhibitor-like protein [Dreissena polymorpha]|uniref:small monomeric GTPase n=1 Tax=Dreissena polymorpha TaxID=45954 RepID=A0A9D4N1R3_DREPO|nr:ras-related and estrogen-regulated growth inhibitor-like protein [Dreissena polymorpha]KAH3885694.1 hypothetical protein DPMN_009690 [Dreissena polymorpha]